MTSWGVSVVKNVVFVLTRKPAALAWRIAATASSNTPSLQTDASCRSRRPSMCTIHAKLRCGVNRCRCLGSSTALVHRKTILPRSSSCRTISSISLCISGSPPAMDTIGAPHSSIAATACSTGIRCLSRRGGLRDLAAARALEVAGEQRLQLDQQRELLDPLELLLGQVRSQAQGLAHRHGHGQPTSLGRAKTMSSVVVTRLGDTDRSEPGQAGDDLVDEVPGGRRARGEADPPDAGEPGKVDPRDVVDQMGAGPARRRPRRGVASWTSSSSRARARGRTAAATARTACWRLVVA